ncbi:MAG: 50S ribosomal protein L18 [Patescibacteria group bacterium]
MLERKGKRIRRHKRIRAKITGTKERPRLGVFCSNAHIYAQLINDEKGKVLAIASDLKLKKQQTGQKSEVKKEGEIKRTGKVAKAFEVGKLLAKSAMELKIENVVFDRGGFQYHGVVKALADGAREGGLKF